MRTRIEPLSSERISLIRSARMTVTVLLFASYAEALGATSLDVEVRVGATVGDVLGHLRALPGADRLPPSPLVAVNERYAKADRVLAAGDEVAVIPPVAGG
jgi:molybdopterin converting factor subunit 1